MADTLATSHPLIAGRFAVDASKMLPEAGGGLPAYAASDREAPLTAPVALLVGRDTMPCADALQRLGGPVDNLMTPMAHGTARAPAGKGDGYYIIYSPPPGPPLSASLAPWPERAILDHVLRPAARVLSLLQTQSLTHRSIRLNNLYQEAPGQPVSLGASWATPPALHQPALYETPYTAICHPAGRGPGTISDDVYALGVVMLILAAGRVPFAGQDDATIIRAKLELGNFEALSRNMRVTPFISDLVRAMVAEEAEHRPPPALLLDAGAARARRVAVRLPRRAQQPLKVGDIAVQDVRTLAYALFKDEAKGIQALRGGMVTPWLRRVMGDGALGSAIEEVIRARTAEVRPKPRSDSLMLMRCIAILNPRMPLCWRGLAIWPDGEQGFMAAAMTGSPDLLPVAKEFFLSNVIETWMGLHKGFYGRRRRHAGPETAELRVRLQTGDESALLHLFYQENTLLPCRLPAMAQHWIHDMPGLIRWLEGQAATPKGPLIDAHLLTFIMARDPGLTAARIRKLVDQQDLDAFRLGEARMLSSLQARHHPQPLPALGKWLAERLTPQLEAWRHRPRRKALAERLPVVARDGKLAAILDLVSNETLRQRDETGAQQAIATMAGIDAELRAIAASEGLRFAAMQHMGATIAAALGLGALVMTALAAVFP